MPRYSVLVACLFFAAHLYADDEGPNGNGPSMDVPELAPLKYWAGRFESRTETPVRTKGKSQGEWVLDGRFLKFTFTDEGTDRSPKYSGTLMMTYDVDKKTYRYWSFFSDGASLECLGDWDAETRTMTWTGTRRGGFAQTYKARFDKDGRSTWTIVIKGEEDVVVYDSRGTTTPLATAKATRRSQSSANKSKPH